MPQAVPGSGIRETVVNSRDEFKPGQQRPRCYLSFTMSDAVDDMAGLKEPQQPRFTQ